MSGRPGGGPGGGGGGGGGGNRNTEQQKNFIRQSEILRKNLQEWDMRLRNPRFGEDWPTMLGRLNAAANQTSTMDRNIEDFMEHFCYLPKQSPVNAGDIPFFLSTRLETPAVDETAACNAAAEKEKVADPTKLLAQYENRAAQLAAEYEENMVRF